MLYKNLFQLYLDNYYFLLSSNLVFKPKFPIIAEHAQCIEHSESSRVHCVYTCS